MLKIQEVIVVEGRDDTKRLKQFFDCETIETIGSAINEQVIQQIKRAANYPGVIVLTDPDHAGERIRKIIMEEVPTAKHAFITKEEAIPNKRGTSLGVEHASKEALTKALSQVLTPGVEQISIIPNKLLLDLGLINGKDAKLKRALLGEYLKIGYTNSKQLAKRLKMFQITTDELLQAISVITEEQDGK